MLNVAARGFLHEQGGDILAGDYLSSVAFRLLVQVNSLPIMGMVSEAIQKACENEILLLGEPIREQGEYSAVAPMIVRRTSALGGAAGATAALLAGPDECTRDAARRFGIRSRSLLTGSGNCESTPVRSKSRCAEYSSGPHSPTQSTPREGLPTAPETQLPLMVCERIRQVSLVWSGSGGPAPGPGPA
jgi:hypothetical protein